MGRKFNIPPFYRSSVIAAVKNARKLEDHRKQNITPSILDLGKVIFKVARHFGFCFGVENAIEIAYRALDENPGRRVFLLSEMIHNPHVNGDLKERGVKFILAPDGTQLIPFDELKADDIVIVPAFGTTVELFETLSKHGINPQLYDATCPFVERVWKRARQLGEGNFTVIIHGKHSHEETRATFSHARLSAPSLVIRDIEEAKMLARYIRKELAPEQFSQDFSGRFSAGFDPLTHLERIGVVNQTTMLAGETQAIGDLLKSAMRARWGQELLDQHFADTRDTLCYATSENQDAISGLIASGGDIAIVVGGYNSSNTSHLAELLIEHVPTFYVKDSQEIVSVSKIRHLDIHSLQVVESTGWLPVAKERIEILVSAGASCPDKLVEEVMLRVAHLLGVEENITPALDHLVKISESVVENSSRA